MNVLDGIKLNSIEGCEGSDWSVAVKPIMKVSADDEVSINLSTLCTKHVFSFGSVNCNKCKFKPQLYLFFYKKPLLLSFLTYNP